MPDRLAIPSAPQVSEELPVTHPWWQWTASFNVAASRHVPVARVHGAESEGVMMRWGLVLRAEGELQTRFGPALISSDSLPGSAQVRDAWLNGQRGIVPILGFYVWRRTGSGFRQPYYVRLADRSVFGVAVLWQRCTTPADEVIESCTLLTVPANPVLLELNQSTAHMPLIMRHEDQEDWLGANVGRARELLRTYPGEQMLSHPVGPYVNHLSFDGPHLVRPVSAYVPV